MQVGSDALKDLHQKIARLETVLEVKAGLAGAEGFRLDALTSATAVGRCGFAISCASQYSSCNSGVF